ncbi:MAG TPA: FHA domain-containing protein, partial [Phycisphaerae bacterium]|nr:FHA domain-containing protein [Phycisphaerae bacterium]
HEAPGRVLRGFLYSFHTDAAGTFWPLYTGRNAAGRAGAGETLEIEIADPTTSSRHASIVCDAASAVLEDDGSTNGTFVNGKRIAESELKPGDRLRLGPVTFVVQINGKPAEIKPEDVTLQSTAEPTAAADDEETFDLNEEDFDLDDPLSALEDDDDDDMP